jgi:hypothetical protein
MKHEAEVQRLYGDYGHGSSPGEQPIIPPASDPLLDTAEAVLSANPIQLARQAILLLRRMENRQFLEAKANHEALKQIRKSAEEKDSWNSFGFRYDPSEGVRHIEYSHGQGMKYLQITTAATNGAGFFYLAFVNPLQLTRDAAGAVTGVQPETWEQVSAIGGPSITLPVPSGAPRVFWYSTVKHEGTIYVATSKDALPS